MAGSHSHTPRGSYLLPTGYSRAQQDNYNIHLQKLKDDFYLSFNTNFSIKSDINDFELKNVLGNGAFGVVFLVKHKESEKFCALKALEKAKVVKLKQVQHSLNEKKILCALKFPFVVCMTYFFKDNVYLYFVLPFIAGGEMFTYLRKQGKFEESTARFYGAQVILALEYLHACDLVYRDLKPENILIDLTGYIKLTDFGFCKLLKGWTWSLCGTPEYLAPEIILSKGYSFGVDWWSTGVLLYEMTSGYPPFHGSEPMEIYEKVIAGKYTCPPHFSKDLRHIVYHTLQVDTTRRYGHLKDGVLSFKNHAWFKEIDWISILNQYVPPPFVPRVRYSGDTSNFDLHDNVKLKDSPLCLFPKEFAEF